MNLETCFCHFFYLSLHVIKQIKITAHHNFTEFIIHTVHKISVNHMNDTKIFCMFHFPILAMLVAKKMLGNSLQIIVHCTAFGSMFLLSVLYCVFTDISLPCIISGWPYIYQCKLKRGKPIV